MSPIGRIPQVRRIRPWWRRYGKAVLLLATALTLVGLWATAAVPFLHPQEWPRLSTLGLAFPIFLYATLAWVVFWCIASWRWVALPLVGITLCWGSVHRYAPINFPKPTPDSAITVMTYNTCAFGNSQRDSLTQENLVAQYIAWQQPDIVALQEAWPMTDAYWQSQNRELLSRLPHWASFDLQGHGAIGIMSRYPVVKSQLLTRSFGNGSAAFWLCLAPRDTIIVVVNHLKSFALSHEQVAVDRAVTNRDQARSLLPELFRKLVRPAHQRAAQADTVAHFVERQALPLISCGDFNDTPISYTYRRMRGSLHDAFIDTGFGPGYTYRRRAIRVRIDHLLYSHHWQAHEAKIDTECTLSDHYPLSVRLTRQQP